MTNKDKFVSTFGSEAYKMIVAKADKDLLLWFLDDYKDTKSYPLPVSVKHDFPDLKDVVVQKGSYETGYGKRPAGSGRRKGVTYLDLSWYKKVVEDLYLNEEKCKAIKISEDKSSLKAPGCLDTLKSRFEKAVHELKLDDVIRVSKYYANTANECVMLDNTSVKRDAASTYAYL